MSAGLLVAKLLVTPALIAGVSWVERRFGPIVAGLVAGLPLTSGPVSVFLALEQGTAFARDAAVGMLAGITAVCAFLLAFAHGAARGPWWAAAAAGAFAYAPAAAVLAAVALAPPVTATMAVLALLAAALAMPRRGGPSTARPHPRWELPLRMAVATALVVGLTAGAEALGARATGLLSPFPVFAAVLGSFVRHRAGPAAAVGLQRGIALGALSFVSFFVVVVAALGTMPLAMVYLLAYVAAAGTAAMVWRLGVSRRPGAMGEAKPEERRGKRGEGMGRPLTSR